MNKSDYIAEIKNRLKQMFAASKEGYKSTPAERHRLEGFMQAGIFLGLAKNSELGRVMDEIHVSVFGKTLQQRKDEATPDWDEDIDYSQYDKPAYERKR